MEMSYLMLGGNIGDRMDYLLQCVDLLRRGVGNIVAMSAIYECEPWGFEDSQWFLNQVVVAETNLDPFHLLEKVQRIEQILGRQRTHKGYHSRTMDIDILLYGNHIIDTSELVIPHPRMAERMFALQPMSEIASDLEHPVLLHTMGYLREHCADRKQVRAYIL